MNNAKLSIPLIMSFIKVFTTWQIYETARDVGFTKRKNEGCINPLTFLKAFTFGIWEKKGVTLEEICCACETYQPGLSITKQSLHERLKKGVLLIKEVFKQAMDYAASRSLKVSTIEIFSPFKDVLLLDGTIITLPDKLSSFFKGYGGGNRSGAGVKIQAVYSILKAKFQSLDFVNGVDNDKKYIMDMVENLTDGILCIFDLGYYNKQAFNKIIRNGSYFISRIKNNTIFHTEKISRINQQKVDILDLLKESKGILDTWIYIGGQQKNSRLKVRVVGVKLPKSVVNERLRKANEKAKRKGKTLSKREKKLLSWNLAVSNVPEQMLSTESVCEVYRIRWQIELIFKSLKGNLGLDKFGNIGKDYFECITYGRMIVFILVSVVYNRINIDMYMTFGRNVSLQRFIKLINAKKSEIIKNVIYHRQHAAKLVDLFIGLGKKSLFEKRKRKTTDQILREHNLPVVYSQKLA